MTALYVVPFLVVAVAFCIYLVRLPHESFRSSATKWLLGLPVATLFFFTALSGSKSATARLADCVIAAVMLTGFVKAVVVVRSARGGE